MRIYIITSLKADPKIKDNLMSLGKKLQGKGHSVDMSRLTEQIASKPKYDEEELSQYHKKMMNSIKQCDMMIVEISSKSSGLGYEIAVALNERKPILAVYFGSPAENSSLSLKSNPSKLIQVRHYEDDKLDGIVDDFIKQAKDKIDTKFILIISPEIDKYLEWSGEERRMHKAQIVRNAIEEMISKDKEYKDFLKDQDIK